MTKTANRRKLKTILIVDNTRMTRVTLWESDDNRLEACKSYRLTEMMVKEFSGEVQLAADKEYTR